MSGETSFRRAARIQAIAVSEILRIGETARRMKSEGRPVIVLGAGEPDFDTPAWVKEAAKAAIDAGQTKYTALDGTPVMKDAVIGKFERENGLRFRRDEVTVGAGAKQILYNAFMATLDPGDEVILAAPYWTSYADIVAISGGTVVPVRGRPETGLRLDPADLEAAITPRTRWLLLNSPSNPSGSAYDAESLGALLDVIARHPQVWLMMDDIYEHLLYDGRAFVTAAALRPDLASRILTINGVSKAYAMTGWRLGYGAGPAELIAAMAVVQSQSTSNPSSISQAAAIAALEGPQEILAERRAAFQARRDRISERLDNSPGLACRKPEGAFYVFPDCTGLIGGRTASGRMLDDDSAVARWLLEDHDVAVVPGSCFGQPGHFRISYAAAQSELDTACDRIAAAVAGVAPARELAR